jgi:hypothetical protein
MSGTELICVTKGEGTLECSTTPCHRHIEHLVKEKGVVALIRLREP